MSEPHTPLGPPLSARAVRHATRQAVAHVGWRLARSLAARLLPAADRAWSDDEQALAEALAFASDHAQQVLGGQPEDGRLPPMPEGHPLQRLSALAGSPAVNDRATPAQHALQTPPGLAGHLLDLVLLASLPEAHEGFATLCRLVHPQGQPWPTVTLALHWLEHEAQADGPAMAPDDHPPADNLDLFELRDRIEDLLCHGPLARSGLLVLDGEGPWHGRTLRPGGAVWPALTARPPRPDLAQLLPGYAQVPGLEGWLDQPEVRQAVRALGKGLPCHILLVGGDAAMRHTRGRALLGRAQAVALRTALDEAGPLAAAQASAWLYGACLWLEDLQDDGAADPSRGSASHTATAAPLLAAMPVISSAASERRCPALDLPQIRLPVQSLAPVARRALWQSLLPQLGDQLPLLAARYPIEPDDAREVVRDLSLHRQLSSPQPLSVDEVGACVRARTAWHARPGIQRVLPRAGWEALLLPPATLAPLQSAVRRVSQQITVLDDWGFAQGRSERRGVRMLFYGPPGTGKTLAAEVMARALGVDLLVVDLSSLVSKYIGETEKNLAAVFEVAERSRALLLFDEADALFGKRTDTQDAHDRYANLETAYLLQRLERYEGVAVLTTNLRGQLDKAFTRRFEYIVEFPDPDRAARLALWRLHLPEAAPLAADVDLAELADWYAISGAQIKNAALGAAFLAAASGHAIGQKHFLWAIAREFDKAGRAHPGYPPQHAGLAEPELLHAAQGGAPPAPAQARTP